MRIAFISPNQEKLPDPVIPIGVLYVMANVPERHERVLWDLCFEPEPLALLEAKVREFQPDLIAIGMRNIQNSDYSGAQGALEYYRSIFAALRRLSDAPIVLGGSGFSIMPAGLMDVLRPNYGIAGEAEESFPKLLAALESGKGDFSGIDRLHYWADGKLCVNPPADFLEINAIEPPLYGAVDPRHYQQAGIASVQTKRGCPLKCSYCTYPAVEGRNKRLRTPSRVVDEMFAHLERAPQIGHFFVVDSVFNLPQAHAKEVCQEMVRRQFPIPWTCYVNPLGFDEELAEWMARAGCAGMEVGSDSGVDHVLVKLKKGFTAAKIRELSRIAKATGLKDCHSFILGTPGESLGDVKETLRFIVDLNPYCAILGVWVDDDEALDAGLASERAAFRNEVKALIHGMKDDYPAWVIPVLRFNFDEKLFSLLRRRHLRGPLWQHIRMVSGSEQR